MLRFLSSISDTVITNWTAARMNTQPAFFNLCSAGGVHSFNVIGGISLANGKANLAASAGTGALLQVPDKAKEGSYAVGPGSTRKYTRTMTVINFLWLLYFALGQAGGGRSEGYFSKALKTRLISYHSESYPDAFWTPRWQTSRWWTAINHKCDTTPSSVVIWHLKHSGASQSLSATVWWRFNFWGQLTMFQDIQCSHQIIQITDISANTSFFIRWSLFPVRFPASDLRMEL